MLERYVGGWTCDREMREIITAISGPRAVRCKLANEFRGVRGL